MASGLCGCNLTSNGRDFCQACSDIEATAARERSLRGAQSRKRNNPNYGKPIAADVFWQRKAMQMVRSAKRHGILPVLDGSYACVDCGKPACIYEHRDYSRPLDVQPVCDSCNKLRGTAKWPSAADFNFKRIEHK